MSLPTPPAELPWRSTPLEGRIAGLRDLILPGDALLIVPPFAGVDRPSLAAHLLQACARQRGLRVSVLYANLALASSLNDQVYQWLCLAISGDLTGERLLAGAAFDLPPEWTFSTYDPADPWLPLFLELSARATRVLDLIVEEILAGPAFPVVGCSTTFAQTNASIALLRRIKARRPDTITLLGGANCEGEMAEGLRSLGAPIDYIFSGECESIFPAVLADLRAGRRPPGSIIRGEPCEDLDALPLPQFHEFFAQRDHLLPFGLVSSDSNVNLPYESSRGCWWGEKHHCTFCGLNGETMRLRRKSAIRVLGDLRVLAREYAPVRNVQMTDNILPRTYFSELLTPLAEAALPLNLFFEVKSNMSLREVLALRAAGVTSVQAGIESLSTELLGLMRKGVTARQNVALLRYARTADLVLHWNLLYGFPGDQRHWYEEILQLLPLLRHLYPPTALCTLSIDRFSPYFREPAQFGIQDLMPHPSYRAVFPDGADLPRLAYHFVGRYESELLSSAALLARLGEEVNRWQAAWQHEPPVLELVRDAQGVLRLRDTRGHAGLPEEQVVSEPQARSLLRARRADNSPETRWGLAAGLCVELDGWIIPLVTAPVPLLQEFSTPEVALRALHS